MSIDNLDETFRLSKKRPLNTLSGSRIVCMTSFLYFLEFYSDHCLNCNYIPVFIEEVVCGLYSCLIYKCNICNDTFTLSNSDQVFEKGSKFYSINLASVLGSLSHGLGFTSMNEIFSMHNVKYMSEEQYKKNQDKLSEIIESEVDVSFEKNFEKKLLFLMIILMGGFQQLAEKGTPDGLRGVTTLIILPIHQLLF